MVGSLALCHFLAASLLRSTRNDMHEAEQPHARRPTFLSTQSSSVSSLQMCCSSSIALVVDMMY